MCEAEGIKVISSWFSFQDAVDTWSYECGQVSTACTLKTSLEGEKVGLRTSYQTQAKNCSTWTSAIPGSTSASSELLAAPGRPARMGVQSPLPAYPRLQCPVPSTSSSLCRFP